MKFRMKFLLAFIAFILFWFIVFYPIILPAVSKYNIHPLITVILYEGLFYLTMLVLTYAVLGETQQKHGAKIAFVLFAIYHAFDSIEPPFILNSMGTYDMSPSAIISWDYGVSYTLHQIFNLAGPALYYVTNIGVVVSLVVVSLIIVAPQTLGKIVRGALK
jgi:hypothetical protein